MLTVLQQQCSSHGNFQKRSHLFELLYVPGDSLFGGHALLTSRGVFPFRICRTAAQSVLYLLKIPA